MRFAHNSGALMMMFLQREETWDEIRIAFMARYISRRVLKVFFFRGESSSMLALNRKISRRMSAESEEIGGRFLGIVGVSSASETGSLSMVVALDQDSNFQLHGVERQVPTSLRWSHEESVRSREKFEDSY